jgi:hypothetical protein
MVFTPTLFSSEKNINIWLEGSVRELVKKLSWLRLHDKAAQLVTRFNNFQRNCTLDSTPVIRILCLEIGKRHIDLLICYLVTLWVGAFSQMSKREWRRLCCTLSLTSSCIVRLTFHRAAESSPSDMESERKARFVTPPLHGVQQRLTIATTSTMAPNTANGVTPIPLTGSLMVRSRTIRYGETNLEIHRPN